jgi:hypothetical protein
MLALHGVHRSARRAAPHGRAEWSVGGYPPWAMKLSARASLHARPGLKPRAPRTKSAARTERCAYHDDHERVLRGPIRASGVGNMRTGATHLQGHRRTAVCRDGRQVSRAALSSAGRWRYAGSCSSLGRAVAGGRCFEAREGNQRLIGTLGYTSARTRHTLPMARWVWRIHTPQRGHTGCPALRARPRDAPCKPNRSSRMGVTRDHRFTKGDGDLSPRSGLCRWSPGFQPRASVRSSSAPVVDLHPGVMLFEDPERCFRSVENVELVARQGELLSGYPHHRPPSDSTWAEHDAALLNAGRCGLRWP